jgi:hypothetical protein
MSPPIIELIGVLFIVVLIFWRARNSLVAMTPRSFHLVILLAQLYPMRKLRLQNSSQLAAAQHVWEVLTSTPRLPAAKRYRSLSASAD